MWLAGFHELHKNERQEELYGVSPAYLFGQFKIAARPMFAQKSASPQGTVQGSKVTESLQIDLLHKPKR